MVMDACHYVAELFRVWGTREAASRIGWTRCVSPPLPACLLFRPLHPGFVRPNNSHTRRL